MVEITLPPVTTESIKKQKQWELESTFNTDMFCYMANFGIRSTP